MTRYGLIISLALITACATQAGTKAASSAAVDRTLNTYDRASSPVPPLDCPSQEFPRFLQRFADASFSSFREQYTAVPLEYVVPSHTLPGADADAPAMHVAELREPDRSLHFRYRYFAAHDSYADVGLKEENFTRAMLEAELGKAPFSIQPINDGFEVTFGLESEVDVYRFARARNCWYLVRATNPRD